MNARRAVPASGTGGKSAIAALAVIVVAVAMMLLLRARPGTQPFDPRSGAGNGTRGLVLLLQRYGADVQITRSVPPAGTDRRVLVLQDRLNDRQRDELRQLAATGAVVVIADPRSPLAGAASDTTVDGRGASTGSNLADQINIPLGVCDIAALAHLRGVHVLEGLLRQVGPGDRSCFGHDRKAFAVARSSGSGVVVALADNRVFTNDFLRLADNGGLATALLAPTNDAKVSIVLGSEAPKTVADIGTGSRTLSDLVRPGVWMALVQLGIAFVVLAIARAVRPGRPVREPEQVPIAGSELVVAAGRLMQRAGHAQRAGALLRGDLFRELCDHHHLPPTTPIDALDAAVAARSGVAPGRVAAVLQRDVADHQQLLDLSRRIQEIRDLVLEGALQ